MCALTASEYLRIKSYFAEVAQRRSAERIRAELAALPFEPYAPIRSQYCVILRHVNRLRQQAGLPPVSASSLAAETPHLPALRAGKGVSGGGRRGFFERHTWGRRENWPSSEAFGRGPVMSEGFCRFAAGLPTRVSA